MRISSYCTKAALFFIPILLLSGCASSNYRAGRDLYRQGQYAAAVGYLDKAMLGKNGNEATRAELMRNQCYLGLGRYAMDKQKWNLAIKLLFLANNSTADTLMVDCYARLIEQAAAANDYETELGYLEYVIRNLSFSDKSPEFLYRRMEIKSRVYGDNEAVWTDYTTMYTRYSQSQYCLLAQTLVDGFINQFVSDAVALKLAVGYKPALDRLSELNKYPTSAQAAIVGEIASLYYEWAEDYIAKEDYLNAEANFRLAVQNNSALADRVDKRLRDICGRFISKGDELLAARNIDGAVALYKKTFGIIPDYPAGVAAVERAQKVRQNIVQAETEFARGNKLEKERSFGPALQAYRLANSLDAQDRYREKMGLMQNMLEIQKDPVAFAKRIINEYKGGKIPRGLSGLEKELQMKYQQGEVVPGTWKVQYSLGQDTYELRYDILTPQKNYYFVWQVDLRTRRVTALNKLTRSMFED